MPWAKVDDQWFAHRKVVGLSLAARGLWTTALSWSCAQRTDHLPEHMVRFLAGGADIDPLAAELEDAGLWQTDGNGWAIHDWDEYQQRTLSEKRSDAGKKGADARWGKGENGEPDPQNMANDSTEDLPSKANGMAGTRPGPSQPKEPLPPDGAEHRDLFDTLIDVCGLDPGNLTHTEAGRVGVAAKQLVQVGATTSEIHTKARAYRRKWPDIDLTPTGLASNWSQIAARPNGTRPRACDECGADRRHLPGCSKDLT